MSDDTALVQSAVNTATRLASGIFEINGTIIVPKNGQLLGMGPRETNQPGNWNGTMLVPGSSFPASAPLVWVQGDTSRVDDIQIGWWMMPRLAEIGLKIGGMSQPFDRFLGRNFRVTGAFGMALLIQNCASSQIYSSQVWQFQSGTFAMQIDNASTWDFYGCEIHSDAPTPVTPIWLTGQTMVNKFYGGLISRIVGEPDVWVTDQSILPPGMKFDTHFYHEGP